MIIMVFDVWLPGWWERARCHSENLATLGHALWVPQGRDIAFLGNAFMWELSWHGEWVDSMIAINCEAAGDERSEALGEGVRILAAIGTVWEFEVEVE